jgi:hypothetical protein
LNNGGKQTNRSDSQCTLPCCVTTVRSSWWNLFCGEVGRLIVECGKKRATTAGVRNQNEPSPDECAWNLRVPPGNESRRQAVYATRRANFGSMPCRPEHG